MTQSLIEQIKAQTEEFNRQRKELVERLRVDFHGLFTEVFEAQPNISHFRWVQYSPYFNDGDPCTFSRHDIVAFTEEDDGEYWEDAEGRIEDGSRLTAWKAYLETGSFPAEYYPHITDDVARRSGSLDRSDYIKGSSWLMPKHVQELTLETFDEYASMAIAAQGMIDALEQIPEDMYEDLFGDHVKVIVTRAGVEVEEYDHD